MPAATTASLPTILRFCEAMVLMTMRSVAEPRHLDHDADEEDGRDRCQDQRHAQVAVLLPGSHRDPPQWCSGCARASSTLLALRFRRGGVSKVWNGAGEGTSHSSPSAPLPSGSFQGRCGARAPLPRITGSTTASRKNTCARPKPKPPTEATTLKSQNCIG